MSTEIQKRDGNKRERLYFTFRFDPQAEQLPYRYIVKYLSITIKRGARHGCVVSLLLCNVYSEPIFNDVLNDCLEGIEINGQTLNNMGYANDIILLRPINTNNQNRNQL